MLTKQRLIVIIGVFIVVLITVFFIIWLRNRSNGTPAFSPRVEKQFKNRTTSASRELDMDRLAQEELVRSFPKDTDGDGLSDEEEKTRKTNPEKADTDEDGFSDAMEIGSMGTDPLKPDPLTAGPTRIPNAALSVTTSEEVPASRVPIRSSTMTEDTDSDSLSDEEESSAGTDPRNKDSDGDTLSDGDEVKKYKTNPLAPDTDNDGYTDAMEIKNGYNPLGAGRCQRADCIP